MNIVGLCLAVLTLTSPDGRLAVDFSVEDGRPSYSLARDGESLVERSYLGYDMREGDLTQGWSFVEQTSATSVDEYWQPVWGEEKQIRNHYNEQVVMMTHKNGTRMNIRFRMFDEGLAFRYEFPYQDNNYFTIREEKSEFRMVGDISAYWIPGDYDTQEYEYTCSRLSEIRSLSESKRVPNVSQRSFSPTGVQTALLLRHPSVWLTIHEAALVDYACMHLDLNDTTFTFVSHLSPDATGWKGHLQAPCVSPWRTIQVAEKATDILANRMTLNLNEPCKIEDTSWIRPMKYIGVWWEMITGMRGWSYTNDLTAVKLGVTDYAQVTPHNGHGATTQNVKRYIDFAAQHGLDGVLVEGWNIGWEDWLGKEKEDVYDFLTPYPDFDLEEVTSYAKQKKVQLVMHHETSGSIRNYEWRMDTAYRMMNKYGYPAVKSGYVGNILHGETHYSQYVNRHYLHCITEAARYRIMVNQHEATRPTGLCRTWPNLIGNESAMGTEYQATRGIAPGHTCILPFTRLNGGPMDYTPGIFEMDMSKLNKWNDHQCLTTLCNQLALYVVMYSPLQMAADLPENYMRFPDAFQFIKDVALDWDQSWYLEAEPMEYVTIARKTKGKDEYFVGGVCGADSHDAKVDFSFLPKGKKYTATVYRDAPDADYRTNPQAYRIETKQITSKTRLTIHEAASGGFAITIVSQDQVKNQYSISSPNGNISVSFEIDPQGVPCYSVVRNGHQVLLPSALGLTLVMEADDTISNQGWKVLSSETASKDETWETVWGEERLIRDNHNELVVHLLTSDSKNPTLNLDIIFRVFNDGLAFRYVFPEQDVKNLTVLDEHSSYVFAQEPNIWSIPWRTEYYEALFEKAPLHEKDTMNSPVTLEMADGTYAFLHEAALTDFPCQNLYNSPIHQLTDSPIHQLSTFLTPWMKDGVVINDKAYVTTPFATPWRFMILTNTLPEMMASRIMLNLNEPCKIEDTSWIRPMKFIGIWWGMHMKEWTWRQGPKHGATTEHMKQYLDFAADNYIQGVLAEGWNLGWEGYEGINNDRFSFVTPYPDYDLNYLSQYAKERGVEIICHHETSGRANEYEADLDTAYQFMQQMGMRAVKTGYVSPIITTNDGHQINRSQSGVRHYRKVIETAAKYHVMIDNHEPAMPTGLQRTWPNLMTQEGIRGQEWNAWSTDGGSPCSHVCVLPFTRMMAGPADYTPGVFAFENPVIPGTRVHSTLANQLALFVVLYSPLQMACDKIENYAKHPAEFQFIKDVPCDWEQSRLLDGQIGQYVVMARQERGGADWYVGAITNEDARDITLDLAFLGEGNYEAQIYGDASDADWQTNPYATVIETKQVNAQSTLTLHLASGGGAAIRFKKI